MFEKNSCLLISRPVLNPIALRKTKIVCNFGLSECNRVNLLSFWGSYTSGGALGPSKERIYS